MICGVNLAELTVPNRLPVGRTHEKIAMDNAFRKPHRDGSAICNGGDENCKNHNNQCNKCAAAYVDGNDERHGYVSVPLGRNPGCSELLTI